MRLALGVEPAPAGAEPGGGEGAVGAAVKPRPPSFSSSPSPAKTVGQVVATLLGPDLTGLETAALEEAAVEVTAAGGKAAARDKGDKGSGEGVGGTESSVFGCRRTGGDVQKGRPWGRGQY